MIDTFQIAAANTDAVLRRFEDTINGLSEGQAALVRRFTQWVEANGLIAVNVKLFVLLELLDGKSYQNIYEWAADQAHLSGRDAEEILKERLGDYYERRTAIDRSLRFGEELRYAALIATGL